VATASWDELTASYSPADVELISAFRDAALALPGTVERVHRTEVAFALQRVFASGFIKSHRLEIAIDLLRTSPHPLLLQAFHTTQRVITHRLTLTEVEQLESVLPLLEEAHRTVGPGTR
jgi:hypothetical protein